MLRRVNLLRTYISHEESLLTANIWCPGPSNINQTFMKINLTRSSSITPTSRIKLKTKLIIKPIIKPTKATTDIMIDVLICPCVGAAGQTGDKAPLPLPRLPGRQPPPPEDSKGHRRLQPRPPPPPQRFL